MRNQSIWAVIPALALLLGCHTTSPTKRYAKKFPQRQETTSRGKAKKLTKEDVRYEKIVDDVSAQDYDLGVPLESEDDIPYLDEDLYPSNEIEE